MRVCVSVRQWAIRPDPHVLPVFAPPRVTQPTGHGVRYHHAAWRSVRRGIVWTVSHPFLSIELIGVGVAIKTIQPYATKALPLKYALLLCTATSATILNIDFQQLMHPGLEAFFMAPGRLQRCGLWLLKLLIALSMLLCLLFPKGTEGWVYLLYTCVLSFVTAMCVIAEKSPKIEAAVWGYIEEREKAHALRVQCSRCLCCASHGEACRAETCAIVTRALLRRMPPRNRRPDE